MKEFNRPDIHTISLFVANKPGVLLRVALIFSRRGFNIESLVVSSAMDDKYSRMTITAQGDPKVLEQIIKQANKLVDVIHASEHKGDHAVEKEMVLIKVKLTDKTRTDVLQIVDHFKAQTVDLTQGSVILQTVGSTEKCDALISCIGKYPLLELVRTGKVVMARGTEET